ncbi:MAG: hypothetical protein ACJA2N_000612 [Salibacteraceae bacterium]|jgi:hypothetical protein
MSVMIILLVLVIIIKTSLTNIIQIMVNQVLICEMESSKAIEGVIYLRILLVNA